MSTRDRRKMSTAVSHSVPLIMSISGMAGNSWQPHTTAVCEAYSSEICGEDRAGVQRSVRPSRVKNIGADKDR
jgi:hypothetical protein